MFELVLRAPEALVEPVSDVLMDELDGLSVSVEDADAGTQSERPVRRARHAGTGRRLGPLHHQGAVRNRDRR
jgi:hypothetical protein